MKYRIKGVIKWVVVAAFVFAGIAIHGSDNAMAEGYGLTMAPMSQKLIIDPGDSYQASFKISNPSSSTQDTYYKIEVEPFYVDEKGTTIYGTESEHGLIADWVTVDVPIEGKLEPNKTMTVVFTVNVPKDAPAGGQYMSIGVTAGSKPIDGDDDKDSSGNTTIKEVKRMAHKVYTEITGNTVKKGEISDISLPSFLLSGKITGAATVKNTGNVHGEAKYTLQIYPLFSSEEVYSNEEEPSTSTILPNREKYTEIAWDGTPGFGIFNVVFTVEFEGAKEQVSKMVIVCPVWLLFTIVFAIVALIIWIVLRVKSRGRKARNTSAAESE